MGSTPQIHQPTSWGRTSTIEIKHEKAKASIEVILVQQQAFALDGGTQIPAAKFKSCQEENGRLFQYIQYTQ